MISDSHTHSAFSFDGHDSVLEMCCAAIKNGVSVFAVTDHNDIDGVSDGFYPPYLPQAGRNAVLEAREYAKTLVKVGNCGAAIHCAAEAILEKHKFFTGADERGQFGFFHGLGHGVGLEIHESPRLSPRVQTPLKGGEVVTVEPGLYYPEWGGIRLEDLVYLQSDGKTVCLTEAPDFLEIS